MAWPLLFPAPTPLRPRFYGAHRFLIPLSGGLQRSKGIWWTPHSNAGSTGSSWVVKAAVSKLASEKRYPRVGAETTGPIPAKELLQVVELAARTGAEVVMEAVNKPRNITYKGITDLVTDTDKMSEAAILNIVKRNFKDHLILGEEGGLIGDTSSEYLWCIDPLDGTTNFAHCYPCFAVSVGVLFRGKPAAASVVPTAP